MRREIKPGTTESPFIINESSDAYAAVGRIIRISQEWESRCKDLAAFMGLQRKGKDINKSNLNTLNDLLVKNEIITNREYKKLKDVIKKRNYINHDFFLDAFNENCEKMEEVLNDTYFYICEATDLIDNILDRENGKSYALRPTVFDKKQKE